MSPVYFVTQVLRTLRGAAPIARRKGSPQSSALRLCRPPLRFALSAPASPPLQGWGDPSPCTLLPPPSPGGVRHVGTCHAWHEKQRPRPRRKHHEDHHQQRHAHQRKPQMLLATCFGFFRIFGEVIPWFGVLGLFQVLCCMEDT